MVQQEERRPGDFPPPPVARVAGMIQGYLNTQLIYVVAKLKIPDLLADGPKSATQLAAATGTEPPILRRVLRGLVRHGLLEEVAAGRFALSPAGELLRTDVAGSMHDLAIVNGEDCYRAWEGLIDAVHTGATPFDSVHGKSFFAYLAQNRDAGRRFDSFMAAMAAETARAVVEVADFSGYQRIVDVGGGRGVLLGTILAATPMAVGVLYDREEVIEDAGRSLAELGVADRCRLEAGSFFAAVPPGGDAYLLAQILHDWDDGRCLEILRACRAAMDEDARLFVLERLMPERFDPSASDVVDMDLLMLVLLGGRERTESELRGLLAGAGFRLERVTATATPQCLLEAAPV